MLISKVVASTRREDHPKGRRLTTVSFSDIFFGQVIDFKRLTRTNCCPSDWCENWAKATEKVALTAATKENVQQLKRKKSTNEEEEDKYGEKTHTHTTISRLCVCERNRLCQPRWALDLSTPLWILRALISPRPRLFHRLLFFVLRAFRSNTFSSWFLLFPFLSSSPPRWHFSCC